METQSALHDVLFCIMPIYAAHSLEDEKTIADIQRYHKNMLELLLNRQPEESMQQANIAISKFPKAITLLEFRAGLFEEQKNYRAAIADCKRIDAIYQTFNYDSRFTQNQNNLYRIAQLQVKMGQFAASLETINRALELESGVNQLSDYLKLKTEILKSLGKSDEASETALRAQRLQRYLPTTGMVNIDDKTGPEDNAAVNEQIDEQRSTEILDAIIKLAKAAPTTVREFQKQIPFKVLHRNSNGENQIVTAPTERWKRIILVLNPSNERILSAKLIPNIEFVSVSITSMKKALGEPEPVKQQNATVCYFHNPGQMLTYNDDRYTITFTFGEYFNSNVSAAIHWFTPEQAALRKHEKAKLRELELAQKANPTEVKDVSPLDGIPEEAVRTWLSSKSEELSKTPRSAEPDEKMESFINKAKVEISKNHPKTALALLIKARAAESEVNDSPRGFADLNKWVTLKSAYIELYKKQRLTDRVKYLETICAQQFKFDLGFVEGWPNLPPFPTLKEYNKDPWEVSVHETDAHIQKPNFIPVYVYRRPYLLRLQQLFGITQRDKVKKVEYIPPDLLDDIIYKPGTIDDDK